MTAVTETISMKVLKEEADMTVIIVTVAVIMIGWTTHHPFILFPNYNFLSNVQISNFLCTVYRFIHWIGMFLL